MLTTKKAPTSAIIRSDDSWVTIAIIVSVVVAVWLAIVLFTEFLWNNVVTSALTVAQPINFWETMGLLVFASIVFYHPRRR